VKSFLTSFISLDLHLYALCWCLKLCESCYHENKKIQEEEEEEEEEEERFDVLIRNELQLLVPNRVYT
jgi:hypothetical protein